MAINARFTHPEVNLNSYTYNQTLTPQSITSDGDSTQINVSFETSHLIAESDPHKNIPPKLLNIDDDVYGGISPVSIAGTCTPEHQVRERHRAFRTDAKSIDNVSKSNDLATLQKCGDAITKFPPGSLSSPTKTRSNHLRTAAASTHSDQGGEKYSRDHSVGPQATKRPRTLAPVSPVSTPSTPPGFLKNKTPCINLPHSHALKRSGSLEAPPRAKSSIPSSVHYETYDNQCIHAAYSSRLSPFALHPEEKVFLLKAKTDFQSTVYLAIRNGILRLWVRNPLIMITIEEALGCATDPRHFPLAAFAHEWLLRKGFINFGCVNVSRLQPVKRGRGQLSRPPTILVVGAGISGLCCARQLQSLFTQYEHRLTATQRTHAPRILVLEGRSRIGGRIHSRALQHKRGNQVSSRFRSVAEMGAQIITGFDFGNPLDIIVRGQLALKYHPLKDNLVLYDFDGVPIDEAQDSKIQNFYNAMLEQINAYSWEAAQNTQAHVSQVSSNSVADQIAGEPIPASVEYSNSAVIPSAKFPHTAKTTRLSEISVTLSNAVHVNSIPMIPKQDFNLMSSKASEHDSDKLQITLGAKMDETVQSNQQISRLSATEMRLLNWHYANLEYSNAVNVNQLSLGGWDQDSGNEFDGFHSQVVGGYSQVVQGLSQYPSPLDVRLNKVVKAVHYTCRSHERGSHPARIVTQDGEMFEADHVVVTLPLGVLQSEVVAFHPPLPKMKTDAMRRLGFGLLNKIILVFESVFWEEERDMFGLLNQSAVENSLDQRHYESQRGKFYLFWNCVRTSGTPMLVALMAGDAAHETEDVDDDTLIEDVTTRLSKIFALDLVPRPVEAIVTRWKKDPFAKGTYSYLGPEARPGDYDHMAEAVGNLHFAGEATCGTHPATVHGALISGLRAACEVGESILGPIPLPESLVAAFT